MATSQIFSSVRRVLSGRGAIEEAGAEVKRLGGKRVLIVSDNGVRAEGLVDLLERVMAREGLCAAVFAEVEPDPGLPSVVAAHQAAQEHRAEVIIGLGGGSPMDAAKLVSVAMTNPGPLQDYFGLGRVPGPGLPLILIPTTAGTGSEATNIAVISDPLRGVKNGIVSEFLLARTAILDPLLTLGLPPAITATTGMDALAHALESYTGIRGNVLTDALSFQAMQIVGANLRQAYANGDDLGARENMLYAGCMAGMAFTNTQNALAHALSMSIGGRYHLPHGLLTAAVLPWAVEFNLTSNPVKFREVARALGEKTDGLGDLEAAQLSLEAIRSLLKYLDIPSRLGSYGVPREDIGELSEAIIATQTRLLSNNPRKVSVQQATAILEANY